MKSSLQSILMTTVAAMNRPTALSTRQVRTTSPSSPSGQVEPFHLVVKSILTAFFQVQRKQTELILKGPSCTDSSSMAAYSMLIEFEVDFNIIKRRA